jgi:hypothetical protein
MNGLTFAFTLLYICLASVATAQNSERFLIKIFAYGPGSTEQLVTFHLQARLRRLRSQVLSDYPKLTHMQKMTVEVAGHPLPDNPEAQTNLWKGDETMLEILSGEYYPNEKPPEIVSDIYMGEDKGLLQGSTITVRTKDTSENYELRNDLLCAVTLYALAIDAFRLQADHGVVSQYLAEAKSLLGEPVSTASPSDRIKNDLLKAVTDQLTLLQQQGGGP